jgi:manganese transport protein
MGLAALGFRKLEALIMVLVLTIAACFAFQIFVSQPDWGGVVAGLTRPSMPDGEALFISLGILGATVMPHNLYLHSAVVQTRNVENSPAGIKSAVKMSTIEVIAALGIAFFVNAAILIVAAALFHKKGVVVEELSQAYTLLKPMFQGAAATAFAVALLASGQSSTITGTLAGQIVMEGFLNLRIKPWARRMITRLLAIVPAYILVQASHGKNTVFLLTLSQVVLSMQLSFAVFPLIGFTSSRKIMGEFANPVWLKTLAYTAGIAIGVLNAYLLWKVIQDQSQPIAIGCYVALGALTLFLIVNSKKRD